MPTGILFPNDEPDLASFAERVESLGYRSLWTGELWTRDAFVALTRAAEVTSDIDLGTAIANVYGRTPATLAQAAATLDRVSDGRARLGLGTSTRKAVEDLHGMEFDNPARRLHETAELAGEFLNGSGRVSYDGDVFEVADFPALGADVPVYTAALGPATRRATGRVADGWLPHNIPFSRLSVAFETVAETARQRDRDPDEITVAPYIPAAVSDDPERAREAIRGHVAYYVGSGEGYRRAVARQFPDAAEAVADAWAAGERERARAEVTDEMVADLGVAGTPSEANEQFDRLASMDVIDDPLVVIPNGTAQEIKTQTIEALSPS
ncbi:LLM class flavin-dependent oxidoreductase [Halovenus sp. WSH3]|uniref:LLM class flavin-dependent oxidoreductase n=1 Tax=Halovenus carboxidivorans TaxID=2692199 RepID=A0A6B0T685_9EURY|nr:LLM class flavin-dependent oxidoreductase [Halovenus carboxidivorans]MXR50731.1 LLM class flavin-dependent oxidoreductase [Halovenus carboxidivorans]